MNKRHYVLLLSLLLLGFFKGESQQWIDQKYQYDSVLNLKYGTAVNFNGGTDTLKLDLYLPQCDDANHVSTRPLLMWIHGGAFLAGDKNDVSIQDLCKKFAKRGYVTASIDYRLGFVSDDNYWQCNYPNYSCVFATDSAEWPRAYYRAMQDAKGALRFLINRYKQYRIDTANVFVAGESAGALTALAVGLLDTLTERPKETYATGAVPLPHTNNRTCDYNKGKTFAGTNITRPDLGGIDGNIEPTSIHYKIKGIGNIYGAMYSDLLKNHKWGRPKPAIFSFHQPCDMVVPIDSGYVLWGLTWCLTNGYGCYGIANNKVMLYGSRTINNWNNKGNYGYNIHNEFTTTNFPFNFLLGTGSCADQVNNPCHAYDNKATREKNLAQFFSTLVSTAPLCDTAKISGTTKASRENISVHPNPAGNILYISNHNTAAAGIWQLQLTDLAGRTVLSENRTPQQGLIKLELPAQVMPGIYFLNIHTLSGTWLTFRIVKE